ncbi:recombinase family protein [Actinoalloteichus hymeniacidonis]|uniref:recombinase family protein n=1 Tax=Actinoalloteichus hymeniacidonis TaxID=340345 RepID=UPI000A07A238|nr:recombinase family protein [Actinoalloteichus hymeniacidonis]
MTVEINNPWKVLDDLLGVEVVEPVDVGIGPVAFYGRCSTEDNQDPETSHSWQVGTARKFVEPLGGTVTAEFFDIGQSRSVPWERRSDAARLLAELKNPNRGWSAVVVGEGTRCWFGNQFSLIAPKFAAYGVELWVPELGGKFDPRNPSHKMLMSVLGGMSESERQHVQARVRAAMDAQVLNEGRHQGGRAPFGYAVVDAGPHPNPRKAAEGYRLRVLEIDPEAAEIVRRIFAEYLDGKGDRAIAAGLNRDSIACPSARKPEQNRHRLADGWQASTVRAILDNPRYTGFAVFGRWTRHETLLDPEDVAAGHVTRFRRAEPEQVVRSRRPAHPAIVSVEDFTETQLARRSRASGGMRGIAKLERTRTTGTRPYLLRGMVRCDICGRKMQGATIRKHDTYYRCLARSLAPGSAALAEHPRTVNLREDELLEPLNDWIGRLFERRNIDRTVAALVASQDGGGIPTDRDAAKQRLAEAEKKLRRFHDAIAAGVDPAALVDPINEAQSQRATARAELTGTRAPGLITEAEVRAMIDSLGNVGEALSGADPNELGQLYSELRLNLRYTQKERTVIATVSPRVFNERVRGGT